jgi:hypothetical protein
LNIAQELSLSVLWGVAPLSQQSMSNMDKTGKPEIDEKDVFLLSKRSNTENDSSTK